MWWSLFCFFPLWLQRKYQGHLNTFTFLRCCWLISSILYLVHLFSWTGLYVFFHSPIYETLNMKFESAKAFNLLYMPLHWGYVFTEYLLKACWYEICALINVSIICCIYLHCNVQNFDNKRHVFYWISEWLFQVKTPLSLFKYSLLYIWWANGNI